MDAINALTPAFQKLSEIFCVSVDAIQANALPYILQYGRYDAINSMFQNFFGTAIVLFILLVIASLFWFLLEIADGLEEEVCYMLYQAVGIACIAIIVLSALYPVIMYFVSPEVYSIRAVIQLLK